MNYAVKYILLIVVFAVAVATAEAKENSPQWVQDLPAAREAVQLFVVAGVGKTTAWVSLHEKDLNGKWQIVMSTPGYIGKNGLGKEREGDVKTPVGVFNFNAAFGIAEDPGCAIPYKKVDENIYWSGDQRPGMKYNQMVDIRDLPGLDRESSEHIVDYNPYYVYVLNLGYNSDNIPGKGSALFLHCLGKEKPYTGGCVAIPQDKMEVVMKRVRPDCAVVIDSLKKLSPETGAEWGI